MTKKSEVIQAIRDKYSSYKIADIAVKLYSEGIPPEDIAYIMQGGEAIKMTPYPRLQKWLAGAMDRMQERIPADEAVRIRQESACCLSGVRNTLANAIRRDNPTIEARFEALSHERRIIGGEAWRENDDFYITYWYAKPASGYTCGCLRCVPSTPMNRLWCECCAGHIRHHFETALGVRATCTCLKSVLNSCGEEACLFRLNIIEEA